MKIKRGTRLWKIRAELNEKRLTTIYLNIRTFATRKKHRRFEECYLITTFNYCNDFNCDYDYDIKFQEAATIDLTYKPLVNYMRL